MNSFDLFNFASGIVRPKENLKLSADPFYYHSDVEFHVWTWGIENIFFFTYTLTLKYSPEHPSTKMVIT